MMRLPQEAAGRVAQPLTRSDSFIQSDCFQFFHDSQPRSRPFSPAVLNLFSGAFNFAEDEAFAF